MDVNEGRGNLRVNIFVLATLSSASASGAVKIRNLSASGALIEGDALPAVGVRITLSRGDNKVCGHVIWNSNGKAGLRFEGRVNVDGWTPGGHSRQRTVDRTFQQIRSGVTPITAYEVDDGTSPSRLEELAKSIDVLADALADEPEIIARLGTKLQTLDLVAQILRKMARE